MKSRLISFTFSLIAIGYSVSAQDAAAVTDDELKKYAVAMDSVSELQVALNGEIKEMVTSNASMPVQRYNELFKVINDEAKLIEASATSEEIRFVKDVIAKKEEGMAKIKQTYQSLAKEYVGASAFNKVKNALSADPALKSKYQTMLEELSKDNGVN
jgi:hypothetical protein